MATRWRNKETVTDFIFGGSQITADGDWSHEIEGCLLLGRKAVTNLDSILKTRDPANKGPFSQGYGFSSSHVWMWELDYKESWAPKNWCFWTVVLKRILESPLDCKEIQESILKEISPEYPLEGLMLKLKFQYFGHLMQRTDSLEKNPDAGKDWRREFSGDDRGWDGWMASPTQWTWVWEGCGSWWWTGRPGMLQFMELQRVGHDGATELNWGTIFTMCKRPWRLVHAAPPLSSSPNQPICLLLPPSIPFLCSSVEHELYWDFPGSPVVKTSPSRAGSISGWGAKIPHASRPKNQNIKQKQYL